MIRILSLWRSQENQITKRPFFTGNYYSDLAFTDEVSDMEDEKKASPDEEKEDDFIQGIKAAREKPWNSLPVIKASVLNSDLIFHPEDDIVAIGHISGELSVFNYINEENKLKKINGYQPLAFPNPTYQPKPLPNPTYQLHYHSNPTWVPPNHMYQ